MKYQIKIVKFLHNQKKHTFIVKTNMQDGILGDALVNWLARTRKLTSNAFCDYVNRKETEHKCYRFQLQILKIKME